MLGPVHFHVNFWNQLICVYISVGILESDFFFFQKLLLGFLMGTALIIWMEMQGINILTTWNLLAHELGVSLHSLVLWFQQCLAGLRVQILYTFCQIYYFTFLMRL